nr:LysR family transcriptional regulator [Pannonibacter phragmitetus]
MAGTIAGAAKLLNVSAPGVSRLIKYTEDSLGAPVSSARRGCSCRCPRRRRSSTWCIRSTGRWRT